MAFTRITLLHQRIFRHQHRPLTTKQLVDNTRFLPPNQSKLAQTLITIFTRQQQPFTPNDPDLLRLAPELNTKVVETVLNGFKRWALAYQFFSWASKQERYRNDMYAFNAMASILSRARQNASLKALVGDVLNSRCSMSPGGLGFFIRCLGNAGLVEEAGFVFDRVREMGLCVPNVYSYNCLLEAVSKSSSVDLVERRLEEMRRCGFGFDKFTLTPVLQAYCNAGESERALSVFNEMLGKGWLDEHVSTVLVVSFCKWGKVDEAFELIEMLEEREKIRLNYKTCCVLIHGFVKESRVDKGIQLFEKMRGMGMNGDIAVYDVLIGGVCKEKDLEMALSLYLEMKRSGVLPDRGILGKLIRSFPEESELIRITEVIIEDIDTKSVMVLYKTLLEGFIRDGLVHDAYSFIQNLMGSDEFDDGESEIIQLLKDRNKAFLPDSESLSSVIDCLVKANEVDKAVSLLHNIVQKGLSPSLLMYNNVIEGMCKEGRSEESLKLLGEMKESGVEPSQFTLNCIYGCLAAQCDVAGALDLLKKMRFYGFEPWIKHSTLLVKKLCEHGRASDACKYLDDVAVEGFFGHMVAYTAAIDGLIKNERVDKGLELFRDVCASGHSPDVIAYHVLIKALCKARRTTEADDLFNEMVSKGLKPSVATYNSMMDGWCKEGEVDRAVSCFARMCEDEKDPDVVTYTGLIHGLCASGRPSEAISRWNEMKSKDCCPNVITFMALIQGLCKCGWMSEALVYFREMEEKEMEPDSAVYLSLISSFLSSGNISDGFGIFREMVRKGRFPVSVDRNYTLAVDAADKFVEDYRTSCYITCLIKDGRFPIVAVVNRK